ncbi:MAG: hypothetical protein BGO95_08070 [Micrococcales bacterium 73-13]|nr:MAG: hypothetical protein BGO95_08070 [Micrococcales bacterium 73-13]
MPAPSHTPWPRSALLGIVLAAVVGVIVIAFSWPSVTASPRDLPIAITGPQALVDPVASAIAEQADGAFRLAVVEDRAAAVTAIERREAYGAIVLAAPPAAPEVLSASAASPVTHQLMGQLRLQLQGLAQQTAAQQAAAMGIPAPTVTVELTDVVPLLASDPRGTGMTAAAFPLVLGGMIGGIGLTMAIGGAWRRVVALLVYSVVGGLAIPAIMQGWFGVLGGDYLMNAAAFGLTLLAIGAPIVGFASLVGRAGVAIGPVLFLLIVNPISGAAMPKEFLPVPWGDVGQWFPPGAGATLIRDLSYFPSADLTFPWLVLAIWAAGGLALAVLGHFRDARSVVLEEAPDEPVQPVVAIG